MKQLKHDINNYAHRHVTVRAVVDFQELKFVCFDKSVIQNEEDMTPLMHKRVDHQQRFFVIDTCAWMQGGYTPDYRTSDTETRGRDDSPANALSPNRILEDFIRDAECDLVICGFLDKSSYSDFSEIFAADFSTWDRRRECNATLIRMRIEILLLVEAH